MTETCYENTTQATTFWVLAETFIHTIYILQQQQPVHRLRMENLMSQCTKKTTQTTMDTTPTATFAILAKTLMHTIYNLQGEQPVYRFKEKTLISRSTNETTQTTIFFEWQQECFDSECQGKGNPYNHFFMITSTDLKKKKQKTKNKTDLCTFCNKDTCNAFCSE